MKKWLLFLVVCITLVATVWSSSEHFSITEFKGGPTHESILLSAFNKVFVPEGEDPKRFTKRTVFGKGKSGKSACKSYKRKVKTTTGYEKFKSNKDVKYLKCKKLKRYPSIFTLLNSGAQWNDMPCFSGKEPWKPCMAGFVVKFSAADDAFENGYLPERTEEGYDVVAQSHFGEKQHYHAMAPTGEHFRSIQITNAEVRDKILEYARHNWERACSAENHPWALTYIGRLLHTVQDSYSEAHVYRAKGSPEYLAHLTKDPQYREKGVNVGDVIFFQGYDAQDHKKHAAVEGMFSSPVKGTKDRIWSSVKQRTQRVFKSEVDRRKYSYVNVHGAMAARDRCVTIWQFWKDTLNDKVDSLIPTDYEKCIKVYQDNVEPFLRDTVFRFAEVQCEGESAPRDATQMYAGGSTRDFIGEENANVKLPCGGQYVSKATLDRYFNGEWSQFEGMAPVKTRTPEEDRLGPLVPNRERTCQRKLVSDCSVSTSESDCTRTYMRGRTHSFLKGIMKNCKWIEGKCQPHYVFCRVLEAERVTAVKVTTKVAKKATKHSWFKKFSSGFGSMFS